MDCGIDHRNNQLDRLSDRNDELRRNAAGTVHHLRQLGKALETQRHVYRRNRTARIVYRNVGFVPGNRNRNRRKSGHVSSITDINFHWIAVGPLVGDPPGEAPVRGFLDRTRPIISRSILFSRDCPRGSE